jgi:peroxiredoxin Q/BCP
MDAVALQSVLAARQAGMSLGGKRGNASVRWANGLTTGEEAIMTSVQTGDRAPDFTSQAHTGQQVSLAEFRGQKVVVLYFYPKDESAICTREACSFRDAYEDFVQAGAVVIGVSSDSLESHKAFASGNRLPFILVADTDGLLRKTYGVPKALGIMPGRVTYVIDKQGVVRHIFSSQLSADRHVVEALSMVRQLAQS